MIEICLITPLSYRMDTSLSRGWDKGFLFADALTGGFSKRSNLFPSGKSLPEYSCAVIGDLSEGGWVKNRWVNSGEGYSPLFGLLGER